MCKLLGIARSSYYEWLNRKPSKRCIEACRVESEVIRVYDASKKRYGSPKIAVELNKNGIKASRPRVARIMAKNNLKSIIKKRYRVTTTDSKHNKHVSDNVLNRHFVRNRPSQAWVSDITYVRTKQGWLYLTIVMDLFDRKIIGWSLSDNMTTEATVLAAWRMAIINRPVGHEMIFHSDRGIQYASESFRKELNRCKVIQSMSRKGNCWDNAVAENFFKILKSEMVNHNNYQSYFQARTDIFEFIEIWYNRQRQHSHLGYLSPNEFGKSTIKQVA